MAFYEKSIDFNIGEFVRLIDLASELGLDPRNEGFLLASLSDHPLLVLELLQPLLDNLFFLDLFKLSGFNVVVGMDQVATWVLNNNQILFTIWN